jgi:hypothetical protein
MSRLRLHDVGDGHAGGQGPLAERPASKAADVATQGLMAPESARGDSSRSFQGAVPGKRDGQTAHLSGSGQQTAGRPGLEMRSSEAELKTSAPPVEQPEVDPPQVAPDFPQLAPLQRSVASLLPLGPAAGQKAESRLEAVTEEDMRELSAKIKRILDEEARRYGIDV